MLVITRGYGYVSTGQTSEPPKVDEKWAVPLTTGWGPPVMFVGKKKNIEIQFLKMLYKYHTMHYGYHSYKPT